MENNQENLPIEVVDSPKETSDTLGSASNLNLHLALSTENPTLKGEPENSSTKPSGHGNLFLKFVILAVFATAVFLFFLWEKSINIFQKTEKDEFQTQLQTTIEKEKSVLESRSVVAIAGTTKSQGLEEKDMPLDLAYFVLVGAENKIFTSVDFTTGEKGYGFEYDFYVSNLATFMHEQRVVAKKNNWSVLLSSRTDVVGITEIQNHTYQARITYTQVSNEGKYKVKFLSKIIKNNEGQ